VGWVGRKEGAATGQSKPTTSGTPFIGPFFVRGKAAGRGLYGA